MQGKFEEPIIYSDKALKLNPNLMFGYLNKGI